MDSAHLTPEFVRTRAMAPRRRLDAELVRRGLAPSRDAARAAVLDGRVLVGGAPAQKPDRLVAIADPIVLVGPPPKYVSRGGHKLEAALDRFGIDRVVPRYEALYERVLASAR